MMKTKLGTEQPEARWPVILTVLGVIFILALLPERNRVTPAWFPLVSGIVVIIPIVAAGLTAGKPLWLRIEKVITLLYVVVMAIGNLANLSILVEKMVDPLEEVGGLQLLISSISIWIINVFMFALLYWQVDCSGPGGRMHGIAINRDWSWPQAQVEDLDGWKPVFVDYLFLAYCTAAAFSPTDVLPLTARAKMLMMLEGLISLATIVVVGARAINILS